MSDDRLHNARMEIGARAMDLQDALNDEAMDQMVDGVWVCV